MLTRRSTAAKAGEWSRNPLVAVVAVSLALLVVLVRSCGCGRGRTDELPPEMAEERKGIHVWCPHCSKTFVVPYRDANRQPGTEPIFIKALKVPCPTCKKADGEETIQCVHCGAYVPVAVKKGEQGLKTCPKCGKYPYGRAAPAGYEDNKPPPSRPRR